MIENEKIREEVIQAVKDLSDEELNKCVEEGKWSIMEVLEHLYLLERAVSYSILKQLENDQSEPATEKPIHLAVNRKTKIQAPDYVSPTGRITTWEVMAEKLGKSRQGLLDAVVNVDEILLENKSFLHPVFGQLSLKQWVSFIGYHEKRHLEQINEIKEQLFKK